MARSAGVQAMIDRHFSSRTHPYRIFEETIVEHLQPSYTVLDIGCGRRAPSLTKLKGRARSLIGLDISRPDTGSFWNATLDCIGYGDGFFTASSGPEPDVMLSSHGED